MVNRARLTPAVLVASLAILPSILAAETQKQEVHVKDVQDGNVIVLGLLGQPVNQMMTLRAFWKKQLPGKGKEDVVLIVTHVNNRQLPVPVSYEAPRVHSVDRRDREIRGSGGDIWEMRGYETCGFRGTPEEYTKELGVPARQQWYGFASELHVIVTGRIAQPGLQQDTATQGLPEPVRQPRSRR